MGELGPFRECRTKSIIVSIFLNLCFYQYWKESFTVQGFTGDNLTCKGLLCLEQSKMRGKRNKYPEVLRWEQGAWSAVGFFRYICAATNLPAPGSSSALCWVWCLQSGNSICLHYKHEFGACTDIPEAAPMGKEDPVLITTEKKSHREMKHPEISNPVTSD